MWSFSIASHSTYNLCQSNIVCITFLWTHFTLCSYIGEHTRVYTHLRLIKLITKQFIYTMVISIKHTTILLLRFILNAKTIHSDSICCQQGSIYPLNRLFYSMKHVHIIESVMFTSLYNLYFKMYKTCFYYHNSCFHSIMTHLKLIYTQHRLKIRFIIKKKL